jgi:oligopeptide transport system ATP-binding protein
MEVMSSAVSPVSPSVGGRPAFVEFCAVTKRFTLTGALLRRSAVLHALNGVTLNVVSGETLGIVGESGCGKSTLGRIAVGLYRPSTGTVRVDGRDPAGRDKTLRHQLQMVFQDPASSLNPRMRVGSSIAEPLRARAIPTREARDRVRDLLTLVGLGPTMIERYPHELSGGQQQRVGIARALAGEPRLIVADEPVSSLDVSQQAQVLNLLKDIQDRLGLTYLFISHDLSVIRFMSSRIAVMYLGKIVEVGPAKEFYARPLHPYSFALRSSVPLPDPRGEKARLRIILAGDVPSPRNLPSACLFRTRCPLAQDICARVEPPLAEYAPGRWVACHFTGTFDETLRPRNPKVS